MRIYLVQHGLARSEEEDASRPLSGRGREEVAAVAAQLYGKLAVTEIRHSGKLRARQTAEILAGALGNPELREVGGMNPNDDIEAFAAQITDDAVMYVGHLPHLQRLAAYLLTGDADTAVFRFRNAAVSCLEQGEYWQVLWSIPPAFD